MSNSKKPINNTCPSGKIIKNISAKGKKSTYPICINEPFTCESLNELEITNEYNKKSTIRPFDSVYLNINNHDQPALVLAIRKESGKPKIYGVTNDHQVNGDYFYVTYYDQNEISDKYELDTFSSEENRIKFFNRRKANKNDDRIYKKTLQFKKRIDKCKKFPKFSVMIFK